MASKKKGLSADEKKVKILELFYERKEFFQMKELEKIAPKAKGVISQSVKEVTQILVDEGFVECEKIGTFMCYWAFPSKALQLRKRKFEDLSTKVGELSEKITSGREELVTARVGKEDSKERSALLKRVAALKKEEETLQAKLDKFAEFDPANVSKLKERIEDCVNEANRWTDNVFTIKKWCKGKFSIEESVLDKQFEIPAEMDYFEL